MTSALIRLMRPHQWIKNGFLFIGVVFGHGWNDARLVAEALVLFVAFCLASSAVYILNDIADRDADRVHPYKRERPLARGEIGLGVPIALCIALALVGVALAAAVSLPALLIAAAYIVLNIGYSAGLKRVAILDVFMIAGGFMLRILAGTAGIAIPPSNWLLLCGLMLTLFLGFCKRRAELLAVTDPANSRSGHRVALDGYSMPLLDCLIAVSVAWPARGGSPRRVRRWQKQRKGPGWHSWNRWAIPRGSPRGFTASSPSRRFSKLST